MLNAAVPLKPILVANELLERFGAGGYIDPLKLQKLLYFANGWYLALSGEPLLSEKPEVWRYGPVFRSVYAAFARFGNSRITEPSGGAPLKNSTVSPRLSDSDRNRIAPFLDWLWTEYGGRPGTSLSDETHTVGTPWQQIAAAYSYEVPAGTAIESSRDYAFFVKKADERNWAAAKFDNRFSP